jgi:dihydroorotate dehydrogenase (fumarate)
MIDLSVDYMGIKLKNPLIVGSSTLTDSAEKNLILEEAGAAAVVLKSLFEEELKNYDEATCKCPYHPEAYHYDLTEAEMIYGISSYIDLIRETKSKVNIPVFASINCNTDKWWSDYTKRIEDAGADAIELNISYLAFDHKSSPSEIFSRYAKVINSVKKEVSIPIAVKFSPYSCSIPYMVDQMLNAGADAVVMFSRYFKMGIDLETLNCMPVNYYSSPIETYKVLRWVSIIHRQLKDATICSNTGIHSSDEALQHLLAGAKVFEVVSTIYENGPEVIEKIINGIKDWMYKNEFFALGQLHGLIGNPDKEDTAFEKIHYNSISEKYAQIK